MWIDDQVLERCSEPVAIELWVPTSTVVVLGSSNSPETEIHLQACADRSVPVLRRYGGGGTVVLYPGCVVISVGTWVRDPFNNSKYFRALNAAVINALSRRWPKLSECKTAGISDISLADRKLAGTSLFRSRNYLLYQASLLVELDLPLVSTLLAHPTKEPDYRAGRTHADFLTDMRQVVGPCAPTTVRDVLQESLLQATTEALAGESIEPQQTQFHALMKRARSGEDRQLS